MRFQPDSLLDAVLRPVLMAAPDANVYVEHMAPDFRFLFMVLLLLALGVLAVLRKRRGRPSSSIAAPGRRAVLVLLAGLALAFVPWLAITGNGRYFAAGLLLAGPVAVGLACLLPVSRAARLVLVTGMVALQAFAVQQSAPLGAWRLVAWQQAPYIRLDIPPEWRVQEASFVTVSAISYSVLAPQFHPRSRWISLHNAVPPPVGSGEARRTESFLRKAESGKLMLLAPVVAGMLTPERLPTEPVARALDRQLAPYRLALAHPQTCRFLAAPALADMELGERTPEDRARAGFWLCDLVRVQGTTAPAHAAGALRHDAVFSALEAQCPRFFPKGGDRASQPIPDGELRSYLQAEMKAYVYDDGRVFYKYYRALNPVLVGKAGDVISGVARVDCANIRGRSGFPWEREI